MLSWCAVMTLEGDMRSADVVDCAMVGFNADDRGGDSGADRFDADNTELDREEELCHLCRLG